MKPLFTFFIFSFISISSFSQSKKDLESEIRVLRSTVDSLRYVLYHNEIECRTRITYLEGVIDKVKFVLGGLPQSPNPAIGSNNPQNNIGPSYQPNSQQQNIQQQNVNSAFPKLTNPGSGKGDGLTPRTGGTIYTGPRGGQYYINKNGNKTYIKKK